MAQADPDQSDPAKDLFKEALEKKRGQQYKSAAGGGGDQKIHGAHNVAGGKRTFRRKAGG